MSFHKVVRQRFSGDCGVATLAMLLSDQGVSYEDVLAAVTLERPNAIKAGLYVPQIIRAAARLGFPLKSLKPRNLDEVERGILRVTWEDCHGAHLVFLRSGQLTDTDGTVWDPDTYITSYHAIPRTLLVLADA